MANIGNSNIGKILGNRMTEMMKPMSGGIENNKPTAKSALNESADSKGSNDMGYTAPDQRADLGTVEGAQLEAETVPEATEAPEKLIPSSSGNFADDYEDYAMRALSLYDEAGNRTGSKYADLLDFMANGTFEEWQAMVRDDTMNRYYQNQEKFGNVFDDESFKNDFWGVFKPQDYDTALAQGGTALSDIYGGDMSAWSEINRNALTGAENRDPMYLDAKYDAEGNLTEGIGMDTLGSSTERDQLAALMDQAVMSQYLMGRQGPEGQDEKTWFGREGASGAVTDKPTVEGLNYMTRYQDTASEEKEDEEGNQYSDTTDYQLAEGVPMWAPELREFAQEDPFGGPETSYSMGPEATFSPDTGFGRIKPNPNRAFTGDPFTFDYNQNAEGIESLLAQYYPQLYSRNSEKKVPLSSSSGKEQ